MTTTLLSVPDISCEHCERAIKRALEPVTGVATVEVDIPAHTVRVAFDESRVALESLEEILAQEEYPVAGVL